MTRRDRIVRAGAVALLLGLALGAGGCAKGGAVPGAAGAELGSAGVSGGAGGSSSAAPGTARPTPTATPVPAPLRAGAFRVNIVEGMTAGVGLPVSVTFKKPVPQAERAAVERQLKVTANPGTEGSWSWVKDRNLHAGQRVDFRPRAYWKPGTRVTVAVGPQVTRHFTVGRSLVATVDVKTHRMTVVKDGVTRRIPITAGAPGMDTWNGTMVVSDKQQRVFMDSRTVGYGDSYSDWYYYAVHLTASGTYLHQNPAANSVVGRRNVTHGCVGLSSDGTAAAFYREVIVGDVVKVVNSTETVAPGNGYGDWNVEWPEWKAGSALR
ncbi:L,D-transpeptidase [Streptomyces sp. NPDC004111]|uniref:L,D-transpeptidase n=1 Tax=Streptomyces sp. NPDC004111 TaxID=3364690 RepID=UPI0036A85965